MYYTTKPTVIKGANVSHLFSCNIYICKSKDIRLSNFLCGLELFFCLLAAWFQFQGILTSISSCFRLKIKALLQGHRTEQQF